MRVEEALALRPRETIAFFGAGGKTTLMFRLAGELVARGHTVVTTTTTRLSARETLLAPHCFACEDADEMVRELPAALAQARHVLAVGCVRLTSDRLDGLPLDTLARIAALPEVDFLLVEADGSRERPFKAPAAHEPVIPSGTTTVVPVFGLDALGRPLTADSVHRPEIVAELAECALGATICPAIVAAVIGHAQGGGKNVPRGARVVPFLNKADILPDLGPAQMIGERLVRSAAIDRVLVGAAAGPDPVWEVRRLNPRRSSPGCP